MIRLCESEFTICAKPEYAVNQCRRTQRFTIRYVEGFTQHRFSLQSRLGVAARSSKYLIALQRQERQAVPHCRRSKDGNNFADDIRSTLTGQVLPVVRGS